MRMISTCSARTKIAFVILNLDAADAGARPGIWCDMQISSGIQYGPSMDECMWRVCADGFAE